MEGDGPTGCIVIPEHVELQHKLQLKNEVLGISDAVYPMLAKMLQKTQEYLDEALQCEILVMATVLHPFFQLGFFTKWFEGTIAMKAESVSRRLFSECKLTFPCQHPGPAKEDYHASSGSTQSDNQPKIFHDNSDNKEDEPADSIDNSLENYIQMSDKMRQKDYVLTDPKAGPLWWSVTNSLCFCKCILIYTLILYLFN